MDPLPNIEDLIPHRDRMLLIDAILQVDETSARTLSTARAHWPLADENGVSPIILIELAAQTAGISLGWKSMHHPADNASAPGGWLVGVKRSDFNIAALPVGARLITQTETLLEADTYKEIGASVTLNEIQIAQIRLQVLQAGKTAFSELAQK